LLVERTGPEAFTATFETEEELREEHRANLSIGALRLPTSETAPLHAPLQVTLRGPYGGEVSAGAVVVAALPDGIACTVDGDAEERLRRLLEQPSAAEAAAAPLWDRMRGLSQIEKVLLAVKADRQERALLLQDNDPRVLLSLLRNPRLTVDEVVRLAKSSFLNFQIADVILKEGKWSGNQDVRIALVHNPKTPPAFALRILPTLPDTEVRAIARSGTSMALKQAALRKLQGK
jgi:hypothetical protein